MNDPNVIICMKCGNEMRPNAKFCNMCGTLVAVPVMAAEAIAAAVQPPVKKKSKKLAVLSFILALIGLAALITLIIICPEIYHYEGKSAFYGISIGIAVFAAAAFIFFILSKKNALSVISCILSVLVIGGLGFYELFYIPAAKRYVAKSYMHDIKHVDTAATYDRDVFIKTYPYDSISMFFVREKNFRDELDDYLYDLYDEGEYSKWIAASMYVNRTLDSSANSSKLMSSLISKANEIDANDLRYCDMLFNEDSPFVNLVLDCEGTGRMRSDLEGRIEQVDDYYNEGKTTIIMSFGGTFYAYQNLAIYKDHYGIIVVDLANGNYFYNGSW